MHRSTGSWLPAALLAALCACGKDEIQVYRLAKETDARTVGSGRAPSSRATLPGGLRWRAPSGWTELPASGMRRASFRVPGKGGEADLSVVLLPGEAGGTLANINRWRGQIGLGALSEGQLAAKSGKVRSPAGTVLVVDFTGVDGRTRLVAGILAGPGESWFFKLTGDARTVGPAKPSFVAFLKSLHDGRS